MRLSKSYLLNRFKRIADIMGWDTSPAYGHGDGRAKVGTVMLQHYHGWEVVRITSPGGGEKQLTPGRMKATELDAWFSGIEFAKEGR